MVWTLGEERGKSKKTKPLKNSTVRRMVKTFDPKLPQDLQFGAGVAFFARSGPRGGAEARQMRRSYFTHHIDEDSHEYWLYEEFDPVL